MNSILEFLNDARVAASQAPERDSHGMVKVYPRNCVPISGWVTFVESHGDAFWMAVAIDTRKSSHSRITDAIAVSEYEMCVRVDDLFAVRFTDTHEFLSESPY